MVIGYGKWFLKGLLNYIKEEQLEKSKVKIGVAGTGGLVLTVLLILLEVGFKKFKIVDLI